MTGTDSDPVALRAGLNDGALGRVTTGTGHVDSDLNHHVVFTPCAMSVMTGTDDDVTVK